MMAACSGREGRAADDDDARTATAAATSGGAHHDDDHAADVPAPTGKVIVIQLVSDEKGNRFEPSRVEAHRGDVLRFTLASGVHNIDFFPDSNPGKTAMPAASDMLQLPGQTLDVPVNFAPGHYYFQCDPHAPLGMMGHLEVEKHD
jgi:plastocyanin